jgi:hypothetical protein
MSLTKEAGKTLREAFKLATAFAYMVASENHVQGYEDAGRFLDIVEYKAKKAFSV